MAKSCKNFAGILLVVLLSACNNTEGDSSASSGSYVREIGDSIKVDAIKANFEEKDSTIIDAYINDKTTITINDIDPNDRSYTTRTKTLYKPGPDGKPMAIVYGFKDDGQKGMAVLQKEGEKPIILKEKENVNGVRVYTDGKITVQKADEFVFIDGVQYHEIK